MPGHAPESKNSDKLVEDDENEFEEDCLLGQCGKSAKSSIAKHADMYDIAFNLLQAMVESLQGNLGYRLSVGGPLQLNSHEPQHDPENNNNGAYFCFSVPIEELEDMIEPPLQPFQYAKDFITAVIYPLGPSSGPSQASLNKFQANNTAVNSPLTPVKQKRMALVIEDSIIVRKTLARALTRQGLTKL